MPNRFVTRIFADRTNPNAAFISYSGFNALTPATPGHVFRAVYNPATRIATFTSLDFDLGDLPINTMAFDDLAAISMRAPTSARSCCARDPRRGSWRASAFRKR